MTIDKNKVLRLYRSLLRLHSKCGLSPEMKQMGDAYVKSEFRQHKSVTNPNQIQQFVKEWELYQEQMKRQSGRYGQDLPSDMEFTDEQKNQLEKLRQEARTVGTTNNNNDNG